VAGALITEQTSGTLEVDIPRSELSSVDDQVSITASADVAANGHDAGKASSPAIQVASAHELKILPDRTSIDKPEDPFDTLIDVYYTAEEEIDLDSLTLHISSQKVSIESSNLGLFSVDPRLVPLSPDSKFWVSAKNRKGVALYSSPTTLQSAGLLSARQQVEAQFVVERGRLVRWRKDLENFLAVVDTPYRFQQDPTVAYEQPYNSRAARLVVNCQHVVPYYVGPPIGDAPYRAECARRFPGYWPTDLGTTWGAGVSITTLPYTIINGVKHYKVCDYLAHTIREYTDTPPPVLRDELDWFFKDKTDPNGAGGPAPAWDALYAVVGAHHKKLMDSYKDAIYGWCKALEEAEAIRKDAVEATQRDTSGDWENRYKILVNFVNNLSEAETQRFEAAQILFDMSLDFGTILSGMTITRFDIVPRSPDEVASVTSGVYRSLKFEDYEWWGLGLPPANR